MEKFDDLLGRLRGEDIPDTLKFSSSDFVDSYTT